MKMLKDHSIQGILKRLVLYLIIFVIFQTPVFSQENQIDCINTTKVNKQILSSDKSATVIWSEDFGGGFPAGWSTHTNNTGAGNNGTTYAGNTAECPWKHSMQGSWGYWNSVGTNAAGNPTGPVTIGSTGPMVSQATYIAWLTDIGDSLRSMGFTQVYFLGDSGGNRRGMQAAADELNDRYGGVPTQFHHVPEFYNHDKVRQYIQETLGIPEEMEYQASSGSDGIHEELSITSVMSVIDPTSIRFDQRVEAGRASINGISLLPLSDTQSLGRMVIDFRTRLTVEAIKTLRVGPE